MGEDNVSYIRQARPADEVDDDDMIERLSADAIKMQGVAGYFEEAAEEVDLDEARRWNLLRGALWHASIIAVDGAFQDLAMIEAFHEEGGDPREVFDDLDTLGGLPGGYAAHYDIRFARRFLLELADVTRKLAVRWAPLSNVAQELALRLVLDAVVVVEETFDLDLPEDWRGHLEDHLFEDTDHEYLYGTMPSPAVVEALRMTNLDVRDWFTPFRNEAVIPYLALDEA